MDTTEIYVNGDKYVPEGSGDGITAALAEGMARGVQVEINYTDSKGEESNRYIEPQMFLWKGGKLQVLAWCTLRSNHRLFSIKNVASAWVSSMTHVHPHVKKETD